MFSMFDLWNIDMIFITKLRFFHLKRDRGDTKKKKVAKIISL